MPESAEASTLDRMRQSGTDQLKATIPVTARQRINRARLQTRRLSAGLRTLPDAVLIGGQRCGTSSLFKWLARHPALVPALRKEVDYFSLDYDLGEDWYRAHFPLEARRRLAVARDRPWLTFEATPTYLFDPRAPRRAAELLPDAKLIVLLRDPVARAVSHYHHNVRHNLERLPLEQALAEEADRLAPEWERLAEEPDHRAIRLRRFSYVARGRYAEQLERWFASYDRDQFLVLRSEDLFGSPAESFDRVTDFLGVERWHPPEFRNYSYVGEAATTAGAPAASAEAVAFLHEALDGPTATLTDLLGPDIVW